MKSNKKSAIIRCQFSFLWMTDRQVTNPVPESGVMPFTEITAIKNNLWIYPENQQLTKPFIHIQTHEYLRIYSRYIIAVCCTSENIQAQPALLSNITHIQACVQTRPSVHWWPHDQTSRVAGKREPQLFISANKDSMIKQTAVSVLESGAKERMKTWATEKV